MQYRARIPRKNAKAGSTRIVFIQLLSACAFAALSATAPGAVAEESEEGDWTFHLAPYLYLPTMNGNATIGGTTVDIDASISDPLQPERLRIRPPGPDGALVPQEVGPILGLAMHF